MTTNLDFVNSVLQLTNQFRAENGLSALRLNSELNAAAQNHAEDMAAQDYFSHTGKDGSQPWDRAKEVGYEAQTVGENIAAGYTTPAAVVEGWKNSPGHRANMLNASYTELGVGYFYLANDTGSVNYNSYWGQLFGSGDLNPNSYLPTSTPTPAPAPTPSGDDLIGSAIGEQLTGSANNDRIYGNAGDDILLGREGNDWLNGGAGSDVISGGSGQDQFVFDSNRSFRSSDLGFDRVTDFVRGTDKIVLDKTSFGAITRTQIGFVNNDAAAAMQSKKIIYSRGSGRLFYNSNGSMSGLGTGSAFALIDSDNSSTTIAPALDRSDFSIVA